MPQKIDVGILGATGVVGQQFIALLADHPWFRVTWIAASERSAGQRYGDLPWRLPHPLPRQIAELRVRAAEPDSETPTLVFSALDSLVAGDIEREFAQAGHAVVSNARNHRMDPFVPLLVPEINADHLALLPLQQEACGWPGFIVTNPNCSTVFLAMALAALSEFVPERVLVTTLQALSGAGYPGVASLDALANVIPFISGEEEKLATETQKILGDFNGRGIEPHSMRISAQCTRVPVAHGHTELVSLQCREKPPLGDVRSAIEKFSARPQRLNLPSAPAHALIYRAEDDRPQPRLDVDNAEGMSVQVGRLRPCDVLDYKFVLLGHNLIRGAAGAAILNAELLVAEGWLERAEATAGALTQS